ncbi:hypothetical protein GGTG_12256 [Gaeumannomyces tritici R3-111a-1]|uniref:Uncharacterized protein n=1 Tax=Gaeumannomyces tritici (strain R3-111a-1) TaxID=644352 RepID=J3PFI1_GAET3|nr:hypothetical protein GGTG_12256 [Gaeumannomyces tritici R3-111a-1]EJT70083.1 hypothetical protein GGTG_12256 [Gaeumannomyces tritici R3-111a-1]
MLVCFKKSIKSFAKYGFKSVKRKFNTQSLTKRLYFRFGNVFSDIIKHIFKRNAKVCIRIGRLRQSYAAYILIYTLVVGAGTVEKDLKVSYKSLNLKLISYFKGLSSLSGKIRPSFIFSAVTCML